VSVQQWPHAEPRLIGRVAVVTGSSSGHGRAIALRLAREGADVLCLDLRKEALQGGFEADLDIDTDDLIRSHGRGAEFVTADVTVPEQLEAAAARAVEAFGRLDIWVNNAGVSLGFASILDEPDATYEKTFDINVKGTWNGARAAVRQMVKQEPLGRSRGRIVNIGSCAGTLGQADLSSYSAAKGAVHHLTRALAIELAPSLINVNTVAPGYFPTAMNRELWDDPKELARVQSMHPLPLGVPDDIAAAVAFLSTEDAAFITGATVPVDGGMTVD